MMIMYAKTVQVHKVKDTDDLTRRSWVLQQDTTKLIVRRKRRVGHGYLPMLCLRLCETLLVLLRLRVHMVLANVCLFQLLLLLLLLLPRLLLLLMLLQLKDGS